jgi:hypothetical protein
MAGKRVRICVKQQREGQEKAYWPEVGTGWVDDKGRMVFTLHLFPAMKLYVFDAERQERRDDDVF